MTFQLVITHPKGYDLQISCPSLGSQYIVSIPHPQLPVTVTRTAPVPTHIATFKLNLFSKDWIILEGEEKKPLNTFMPTSSFSIFSCWYVFKGQDGKQYRWKLREDGPALFKGNIPIAAYYRKYKNEDKKYFQVYDSSLQNTLDYIILTLAIMETLSFRWC